MQPKHSHTNCLCQARQYTARQGCTVCSTIVTDDSSTKAFGIFLHAGKIWHAGCEVVKEVATVMVVTAHMAAEHGSFSCSSRMVRQSPMYCVSVYLCLGSLDPKRHLGRFSHFYAARPCDQHTDIQRHRPCY